MSEKFTKEKFIGLLTKPRSILKFSRFIIQNFILMSQIKLVPGKRYYKGKVTIITPTFKRLNSLREAIKSVQDQSYPNWEQIIVSDGFEKDVKDMVESLQDSRVSYYFTYPLHVMGNYQRNYALKYATGEYILYLDDDNILFENCLKKMTTGFYNKDIGYVVAPIKYGQNILYPKHPFKFGEIDLLNYMVRRRLVENINGQNMHACADLFLIQKINRIAKGSFINDLVAHHR